MALIKCGECGKMVSEMAYVCPNCGRDIRVLQSQGCHCRNCDHRAGDEDGPCNYGPNGYPCLHWEEYDDWLD
ncbi:MAG: hypothetical protein J1F33_02245 [Clostridiales bacterium]|nr:hypothetical protein [Clostridiales bacterium]